MVVEPGINIVRKLGCLRMEPSERSKSIVVSCREAMFRSESIFNRNPDGLGLGCHTATEGMESSSGGAATTESTAMEMEDDGCFAIGGRRRRNNSHALRKENTGPSTCFRIERNISGSNSIDEFCAGRGETSRESGSGNRSIIVAGDATIHFINNFLML